MHIDVVIFEIIVLIFSVIVHEISHGYVAEQLGDPTARLAGRLTLNPLAHIDPVGSIFLPLLLSLSGLPVIGWAKPVPYNPSNLYKDYKNGPLKVALAGPLSNLLIVVVFGLIARFGFGYLSPVLVAFFGFVAILNAFLAVFNLMPIPPLDGSKLLTLFLPEGSALSIERFGMYGFIFVLIFVYLFSGVVFWIATNLVSLIMGQAAFGAALSIFQ